ncbi:hypothetical protein L6452_18735 [Arctium lappa]|uniref:Uncharacterized protein n=1 Tax=Arctium lappa TaxID=4217 RepID=A0ACB9C744_ARCLA|nr:hypothetical protein L6452_18735 [Arctium lappa]
MYNRFPLASVTKKSKLDGKKNKSVDPVALITKQLSQQALSDNAYNGSTDDDSKALQKAMILLSQHYHKKFQPRSGSNSSRFTYASTFKVTKLKTASCYNCGKSGHYSKKCRAKKVRDSAYYRKKMELAEKRENGTDLLAEEEFWLDYSNDEASNVEIAQMCLIGDDQSDDSDTVVDESKILDDSFTLNDQYYKPKRKRRRSKKSKKHDTVLSDNSNSSDSILTDRALSARSKNQILRAKLKSTDSMFDEDVYEDKYYKSDSFAMSNKISKYSRKQMIQISKNVSYSSSDSSLDDYALSYNNCAYYSDDIFHGSRFKSAYYFPIRTATNFHGPKYKWVPKSKSDSKLQASHVKGE